MKPAPDILMVDDNPADVALVCEALVGSKHRSQINKRWGRRRSDGFSKPQGKVRERDPP